VRGGGVILPAKFSPGKHGRGPRSPGVGERRPSLKGRHPPKEVDNAGGSARLLKEVKKRRLSRGEKRTSPLKVLYRKGKELCFRKGNEHAEKEESARRTEGKRNMTAPMGDLCRKRGGRASASSESKIEAATHKKRG